MNQFKLNSFRSEFSFLNAIIDGQPAVWRSGCHKCGGTEEIIERHTNARPVFPLCPKCFEDLTVTKSQDYFPARDPRQLESVQVKRADANLLNYIPKIDEHTGSMVNIECRETVHFVIGDDILANAVDQEYDFQSNYAHTDPRHDDGESVLEAINRHGVETELRYAVMVESGYEVIDHCSTGKWRITIYKPEKHVSWSERCQQAQAKADAEVKAETDF